MATVYLGQVFTPSDIVDLMISLIKNKGDILEPSAGPGRFSSKLNCTELEIDPTVARPQAIVTDFFLYPTSNKFDTIIGNPPYLKGKDIPKNTRALLSSSYPANMNLFVHFIDKCIDHLRDNGELIFIVPRDFIKSSVSTAINEKLFSLGTITDLIDLGDEKIFEDAQPNCVIFRYVKNDFSRKTKFSTLKYKGMKLTNSSERTFSINKGFLSFVDEDYSVPLSDLFDVFVGAVSGNDSIFHTETYGNVDMVVSHTRLTKATRRFIYEVNHPYLLPFKETLLKRKSKLFTENNWWEWARVSPDIPSNKIYVNCKTRVPNPFFTHPCNYFDGSTLALVPKVDMDINTAIDMLNKVDWDKLGFMCNSKYVFQRTSLLSCLLPKEFERFLVDPLKT